MTAVEHRPAPPAPSGDDVPRGEDVAGRAPWQALVLLAVVVAVVAALGAPARSAKSGQTTSDEPQYLLSAISLFEDLDLDISDELAEERYREFHAADLPQQTQPRPDGSRISPHDPLLPAVLAVPTAAGGWVGARMAMAAMAGVLAALTAWVAIVRFGVSTRWSVLVVGGLSVTAPLVAYGSQLYPELPAALVVMAGVAALTGPLGRQGRVVAGLSIVALPWLAVKYTPVAAALALATVVLLTRRGDRRQAVALVGALAAAGVVYLWFHQAVYGGWTAYASGDHFVDGELLALGADPDPGGRAYRLAGLLTDRDFGLVAWAPAYLLVVAAVVAFVRARPARWAVVVAPLAVGWLNATFVAESMHDWSWPGRQVVVVIPLAVVVGAWWIDRVRPARLPFAALTAVAVFLWSWLLVEIASRGTSFSLAVDFHRTDNPLYAVWAAVRPDHRNPSTVTPAVAALWVGVLGLFAWWGYRSAGRPGVASDGRPAPASSPGRAKA